MVDVYVDTYTKFPLHSDLDISSNGCCLFKCDFFPSV